MKLSIITPSFNSGPWLPLCIASVADQAGVEVEHIVQDAGSTDGTLGWLPTDSRVRAFVEKDEGMYDAINRGLRRASGDVLAYLNCDEQYLPGALRQVADFFAANPTVDVLFGDALLIDRTGRALSYRKVILPLRAHVRQVHLNTLTCATFFRRSIVERGFFFDPTWKAIGDAVWVDKLLAAGVPMGTLAEPLSAFAFTGANLGASPTAIREGKRLGGAAWRRLFVPALVLHHRWRKWRAGAYGQRSLTYAIYTPSDPATRQTVTVENLGFGWPHALAVEGSSAA